MLWLRQSTFTFDELWSRVDFQLNLAFDVVAAPGWSYENESLPQSEVWLIRSGRCAIQRGSHKAIARAGDIVVLMSGEYRLTSNADDVPLEIMGFGCHAHIVGSVDLIALAEPLIARPNASERFEELMRCLLAESCEQAPMYSVAASGYAQLALVEVLRSAAPVAAEDSSIEKQALQRLQSAQNDGVARALELVASHHNQHLDITQMARAAHLSPAHFSRKFKAALGLSPMEYLRIYRLRQAQRLLAASDEAVAQVALRCGFDDAAYFSRAFKQQFGSSPLEFRRYLRALSK